MNQKNLLWALGALALVVVGASPASADTYGFSCISGNAVGDCAILEAQITVDVTVGSGNTVNFRFTNSGPLAASITDVHFNDTAPPLLGTPVVITDSGAGVSFQAGCTPSHLPGSNSYGFTTTYCAQSTRPTQPMGVNPGEWLNVAYTLQAGYTFADVITAMNTGNYLVGVKVQGFASGGSETGITQVPEPSSLLVIGVGLVVAPFLRRRRVSS